MPLMVVLCSFVVCWWDIAWCGWVCYDVVSLVSLKMFVSSVSLRLVYQDMTRRSELLTLTAFSRVLSSCCNSLMDLVLTDLCTCRICCQLNDNAVTFLGGTKHALYSVRSITSWEFRSCSSQWFVGVGCPTANKRLGRCSLTTTASLSPKV